MIVFVWNPVTRRCVLQGVMPPAQGLVLLLNLREGSRPLAPRMASLLLRLYALAAVPITLWMTIFVSQLSVKLIDL
jgi:hypothetical protein